MATKKILSMFVIVAGCCILFARTAKADVYGVSDVMYYEPTNSIWIWAETRASYTAGAYYTSNLSAVVYKDDEELTWMYAYSDQNAAYAEMFIPYDPNVRYEIDSFHEVEMRYEVAVGLGNGYYDYDNYDAYRYGEPVWYPAWYDFVGAGPERTVDVRSILLGTTFRVFEYGAAAGPPHHVKVVSDKTFEDGCGNKDRWFRLQVVDNNGRRAGTVTVREQFLDAQYGTPVGSVYNSCQHDHYRPPGCLPTYPGTGGQFVDRLWVGCPTVAGDCGFSPIISRWVWCPRGRPEVSLTTNRYEINRNSILINGVPEYPSGTHLY